MIYLILANLAAPNAEGGDDSHEATSHEAMSHGATSHEATSHEAWSGEAVNQEALKQSVSLFLCRQPVVCPSEQQVSTHRSRIRILARVIIISNKSSEKEP